MLPLFLLVAVLAGSRAAPINPVFGRDLITTTPSPTSLAGQPGPTPTWGSSYVDIPEPSPTGFPPGPSIKTVTQTSTTPIPGVSSSVNPRPKAESEPGLGLAVGPPGSFSNSASPSPGPGPDSGSDLSVGDGVNGNGNGTLHHLSKVWNCTITPSSSNNGTEGTANCTLLDYKDLHSNSTQSALESLGSGGNKTSSPLPLSAGSNTPLPGPGPEEEEVEEEWEIVYECDEYEPLSNTTATPPASSSSSSSAAPTFKQADVNVSETPSPVPAGQGSKEMIPLTPSPVNPEKKMDPAESSQPSGAMDKMMNLSAGGSAMGGNVPSRALFIRDRLRSMRADA